MYTKCNKCGAVLRDPGEEFLCPKCHNRIKSRTAFLDKLDAEEELPPIAQYGEFTPFNVFKALVSGGTLLAQLAFILSLIMCSVVLLYALPTIGAHWNEIEAIPFIMVPTPLGLTVLTGPPAAAYFAFIALLTLWALAWTVWPERKKLIASLKDSMSMLRAPTRDNKHSLFLVGQMFMAILFFDMVYYYFIDIGGADPASPDFHKLELWENMYGFLNASVWEEIAGRILLIGAPFLFYKVLKKIQDGTIDDYTNNLIPSLKKSMKLLAGGHNDFRPIVVGLIVFSSVMFGFAHMSGWDAYKVLPTAISGLGFGYLYVKKGLHAAIVLHFMFDYLGLTQGFLPDTFGVDTALLIIFFLWTMAGFIYFVYYGAKIFRFFAEPDKKWVRPRTRTTGRKLWDILGWK